MSKQEKILDDIARLAGGAAGLIGDTKEQIKLAIKSRVDEIAQNIDLVPREDFEQLQASHQSVKKELEILKERINLIEQKLKTP